MKFKIIFRVDADKKIGWGHFVRCATLAKEFKDKANSHITFITKSKLVAQEASCLGYHTRIINKKVNLEEEVKVYKKLLSDCDAFITDKINISASFLKKIKYYTKFLVSIDDESRIRFCSDILIRPNLNDSFKHAFSPTTEYYGGSRYIILRKQFSTPVIRKAPPMVKNIFVCFGGSDPNNLTKRVCTAVSKRIFFHAQTYTVVLGKGVEGNGKFIKDLDDRFVFKKGVENIGSLMTRADMGIVSGGTLLYEASRTGLPSLVLCQNKNQEREEVYWLAEGQP
jgi:spore coat polysaccharide biosynthesis predicted glycosyltransferase SpsG